MSINYTVPMMEAPVTDQRGIVTQSWWEFFKSVSPSADSGSESVITVGVSPFSYTTPDDGFVLVQGGTVSAISITRKSAYATGLTAGMFPVGRGDILIVTYTGSPNMVMFPL